MFYPGRVVGVEGAFPTCAAALRNVATARMPVLGMPFSTADVMLLDVGSSLLFIHIITGAMATPTIIIIMMILW